MMMVKVCDSSRFGVRESRSVLDRLSLRCLLNIYVGMLSRKLNI